MAHSKNNGGLKPLPKPVRPVRPSGNKSTQNRPPAPPRQVPPIDPDDFEFRKPNTQVRKRISKEPTMAEAFIIFLRRMYKQYWPVYKKHGSKRRNKQNNAHLTRLLGIAALAVVCVLLIVSIIWSFTNKNAYAVYLGDKLIGHIALAKDIEEGAFHTQAVNRLEASLGAKVQVNETVTLKQVHSSRSNIKPDDEVIDQVYREFTYKISATAIYVEGREIAILKTKQEAESVAEYLWAPYLLDGVNYVEKDFVEDWELITKQVDQEELESKDDALIQLDKKERTLADYTIQDGDTLGGIARRNNTTVDKICSDNPGYTASTILRVGNILKLETTKPYLSVRTVEEITRRESIPMPKKTIDNELEYKTYSNVIQEGKDGEREVTLRITRINGIQTGPEEEITSRNTIDPIERIVEVGTSENAPQRR